MDRLAYDRAAVRRPCRGTKLEVLRAGLIVLNKIVNAGKIQAPRDRQGHRRPVDEHRVSGDGEGKEKGGQESSGEHDSRRSGRCSSSGNSMKTRRNIPLPFIS